VKRDGGRLPDGTPGRLVSPNHPIHMTDTPIGSKPPRADDKPSSAGPASRLRSFVEWGAIVALFLFLRFTPQGTSVVGFLQRGLLATGLIRPDIEFAETNDVHANYDVELETLAGESVSMASMRGQVIFMNIWATWCAPCLAEMPYIQNLFDDVASDDIVFVMISADESAETARRYIERKGYTFPVYRLRSPLPEPYTSTTLPTTYVISADGELATIHAGMSNVDTAEFRAFLRGLSRGETL
jgi:thiol-disulfide isomerase/thioredoxin